MEWVKLGDIVEIYIGKTPTRGNLEFWGKGKTWLSIADLTTKYISNSKEEITQNAVKKTGIKLVPKDTVIMSFKLSIGKVAITEKELYTNEAIAHFIPKIDLLPEYLYYALQVINYDHYTDKAVKGKTLNKKKLNVIEVPICSISEQEQIVQILNQNSELISTRQAQLQALDDLVESIFQKIFYGIDGKKSI